MRKYYTSRNLNHKVYNERLQMFYINKLLHATHEARGSHWNRVPQRWQWSFEIKPRVDNQTSQEDLSYRTLGNIIASESNIIALKSNIRASNSNTKKLLELFRCNLVYNTAWPAHCNFQQKKKKHVLLGKAEEPYGIFKLVL